MRAFGINEATFIITAVRWTLLLSALAFTGGGIGGLLVALARTAPPAWLRRIAGGYIQVFQGTPLLMQLFLVFFGANLFGADLAPLTSAAIALTLNAAAFLGEIWRGSIEAIPRTQWEAAQSLALTYPQLLFLVILPQALRISIPATVGFLVQLIKSTAIASLIGFVELTRAGQLMTSVTFDPMTIYPLVALLYFLICWPLSLASGMLERKIGGNAGGGRRR